MERLRPYRPNQVWAYDFVEDRTRDGRKFRTLNVVDEFTCEALAIRVGRQLKATDVIDVLADLFITHGTPVHIRSDNGPEFAAIAVKGWIMRDLQHAGRSEGADRAMARALQHRPPPFLPLAIAHQHQKRSSG